MCERLENCYFSLWFRIIFSLDNFSEISLHTLSCVCRISVLFQFISCVVFGSIFLLVFFSHFLSRKSIQIADYTYTDTLCLSHSSLFQFLYRCALMNIFAGSTNCALVWLGSVWCNIIYLFLPRIAYSKRKSLCITVSNSQLFSMDVSSNLHANDRKHDMQPSSKHNRTPNTWVMVSNANSKSTAHGALSVITENHVWTAARGEESETERDEKVRRQMQKPPAQVHPILFHLAMLSQTNSHTHTEWEEFISVFRDVRIN